MFYFRFIVIHYGVSSILCDPSIIFAVEQTNEIMINLYQTHFFALFTNVVNTLSFIQEEIPKVFSQKMQCILISVAKGPE